MPIDEQAQRLVVAAVSLPITIGTRLVDEVGSKVERARKQIDLARFVGKMAIEQGTKELQRRLAPDAPTTPDDLDDPRDDVDPESRRPRGGVARIDDSNEPGSELDDETSDPPSVDVETLALPDYDQLPASHIVGKLAGLTPSERADIRAYESTHRHRRTVLGKLDQLESDVA